MTTTPVEQLVYQRPEALSDVHTHYCPGCLHGVAHRLIAEVIDELGIRENTIGVAPVGCSVFCYNYFEVDFVEAAHGRAPAMATGVKRVLPDGSAFDRGSSQLWRPLAFGPAERTRNVHYLQVTARLKSGETIERARAETAPATRHALYRQLEESIARDALLLPLFHEQAYRFARPEVEGLSVSFGGHVAYEDLHIRR